MANPKQMALVRHKSHELYYAISITVFSEWLMTPEPWGYWTSILAVKHVEELVQDKMSQPHLVDR